MIVVVCSWSLTLAFVAIYLRAQLRLVLVARACHELRGPLFAVQLGLDGLAGDPARMAAIELELARAGRALDDLTAAPRGRRVQSRRELVDLDALLESYAPAWRTLSAGYGATLHVEPPLRLEAACAARRRRALAALPRATASDAVAASPATVFADPLRIAQACANLIGNAAEHGGGAVRVRVRTSGEFVRIEVADEGPGLPASVTGITASARSRRGRRGHGLAIAAAIATDHGGRVFAAPAETGARLVFELPAVLRPLVAA